MYKCIDDYNRELTRADFEQTLQYLGNYADIADV